MMRRTITPLMLTAAMIVPTAAWSQDQITSTPNNDSNYTNSNQEAGTVGTDSSNLNSDSNLNTNSNLSSDSNMNMNDQAGISTDHNYSFETAPVVPKNQRAGTTDDTSGSTTAQQSDIPTGPLAKEGFGFKPQAGVLVFDNLASGVKDSRLAAGLTMDWNLTRTFVGHPTSLFIAPSTGAIFSHIGSLGSNFVGSGDNTGGANILLIPANLKLGYALTDGMRISAHGGGNVIYRSQAGTLNLGPDSVGGSSLWKIYPNVGGDLEFGIGNSASLLLRPDWTFTSGNNLFTGTLGLSANIG